ncbi:MAG: glycosyltransferase [Patescibacteria group bacterium]|nr:glycosyltransferase [Patescibacteria group bacterium]
MSKVKLSIILVHYGDDSVIQDSISRIFELKINFRFELIVVDNNEKKSSLKEQIPKNVVYIKPPKNLGYGGGNNLGARNAKGEYLLILNPDVFLYPFAIDKLIEFLDKNKNVAAVSPILTNEKHTGTKELTPVRAIFAHSFIHKYFPKNFVAQDYKLANINKNYPYEVDTLPGCVFMIRKSVFFEVGAFDENMFLYYEESDLGRRIKAFHYLMFVLPYAKAQHKQIKGQSKNLLIENIKSRRYYFLKHYGYFWMLFVEMFCGFSKWHFLLFLILILALCLRLVRLPETFNFAGDVSWYFLEAKNMLVYQKFPLVGIESSVPILSQGAVWTWILALFLYFGDFNPIYALYLTAIWGVANILLFWLLLTRYFNKAQIAIGSLFLAVSPFIVENDRSAFVNTAFFAFLLLFSFFVFKFIKHERIRSLFWAGFSLGIAFQVELAAFLLFPVVIFYLFLFFKLKFLKNCLYFISGFFVSIIPFFIYDYQRGVFIQTVGFGVWFLSKFLDLFNFNQLTVFSINNQAISVFGRIFVDNFMFVLAFLFSCILIAIYCLFYGDKIKKFIALWFCLGILGFFVRGSFSDAYMPILYLPIAFLVGDLGVKIVLKNKILGISLIFLYLILSFFKSLHKFSVENSTSFLDREKVAQVIVEDLNDKNYKLLYIGPNSQFKSGDSQWRYLLWTKGNKPDDDAKFKVLITESLDNLPDFYHYELTRDFGGIKVGYLQ